MTSPYQAGAAWPPIAEKLEPLAAGLHTDAAPATMNAVVGLSVAISLKRIADALEGVPAPGGYYSLTECLRMMVEGRRA